MNLIPMSDYPTASDERSRIQAQTERKAELSGMAQHVDASQMNPAAKQQLNDRIQEKVNEANQNISHLRTSQAAKQKAEAERRTTAQMRKADESRLAGRKAVNSQKLDTRA